MDPFRPSSDDLREAVSKTVPDIIAPNLKVLFCGINPGLYTAATGFHFARPGNRFWTSLYHSGFTSWLFHPSEQQEMLSLGLGITNFVSRTSATAAELSREEIIAGAEILKQKVLDFHPHYLAILGIGPYRTAFNEPKATVGLQTGRIGDTKIWLLPNPSGLNANYSISDFVSLFSDLRAAAF